MKIGIMGGTFDPIHIGHLILAERVRDSKKLDQVIFIPTGVNPLKKDKNISSSVHRLEMLRLAIESNPYFSISTIEIERGGLSYTIDTLRALRVKYKDDDLYFIIGSDIIFQLEKWKDFKELFKLCKFILVDRPGNEYKEIDEKIQELNINYQLSFERITLPLMDISSSDIRNRVKSKKSIKYLVPTNVEDYIKKHKLYLEEE